MEETASLVRLVTAIKWRALIELEGGAVEKYGLLNMFPQEHLGQCSAFKSKSKSMGDLYFLE